jgi:hypothetical protein
MISKAYVITPKRSDVESLKTISSIAALEGAQTRIFFTPALTSIDIIPFMVCVFPVPGYIV